MFTGERSVEECSWGGGVDIEKSKRDRHVHGRCSLGNVHWGMFSGGMFMGGIEIWKSKRDRHVHGGCSRGNVHGRVGMFTGWVASAPSSV